MGCDWVIGVGCIYAELVGSSVLAFLLRWESGSEGFGERECEFVSGGVSIECLRCHSLTVCFLNG